jgi:hypothetical protein
MTCELTVVAFSPCPAVNAVVRVQEHDEACTGERLPDGLQGLIIEALAEACRAHDDATKVRESGDLLNSRDQRGRGGLRHQRKEAEAVEALELGRCGSEQRSCRAVMLEVLVQLLGKRLRGVCRKEVEPWVRRAAGVRTRSIGIHRGSTSSLT